MSRLLCLLFAILGALPLGTGSFIQSEFARTWASRETSRLLRDWLGLRASYTVELALAPLSLALNDLRVEATDGGPPALQARRVAITPQIFSLLAGRLDVGELELEGVEQRLVFRKGKLWNLDVRLPATDSASDTRLERSPFRSLSATDARLFLDVDGVVVDTGAIDLDVFSDEKLTFEVAIRAGESRVRYPESTFVRGQTFTLPKDQLGPRVLMQWDEDRLCSLDARIQVSPDGLLIRRLELAGAVDVNPLGGSTTTCPAAEPNPNSEPLDLGNTVNLQLRQVRFEPGASTKPWFSKGTLKAQFPVDLINRFTDVPGRFEGWAKLDGDFRIDGSSTLPNFAGKFETGEFLLAKFRLVEHSTGDLVVRDDEITVPELFAGYGGGDVEIRNVHIWPLKPGAPLTSESVHGVKVRFPYLIRDVKVTPNTIINWDLNDVLVSGFSGNLAKPVRLDGALHIDGSNFEIFDRAYHDPKRRHIIGVAGRTRLDGHFGLRADGLEFDDIDVRFPGSSLHTTVHIGFDNQLKLEVPKASLDLATLSPLVTLPISGTASLTASSRGAMRKPTLTGAIGIEDLVFSGFPVGTLQPTDYRFEPVWVELSNAVLSKNNSRFVLPRAHLDFGTNKAKLQAEASLVAQNASIRDFLAMWNLEQDPGWLDLKGALNTRSRLTYSLGGKADPCGAGDLRVVGNADVANLTLFDENYDNANAAFDFHWEDIKAGYHGFHLGVNDFALRKGAGTLLGTVQIRPGAAISGNLVATAVPINQLQALGPVAHYASGTISAFAKIGGSLDQLQADVQTSISPLVVGRTRLPASRLAIQLAPRDIGSRLSGEKTGCNRAIPAETSVAERQADRANGDFKVKGQLFGNRVRFRDFSVSRQQNKVARGQIEFENLELGPLFELRPEIALQKERPSGYYTGKVTLNNLPLSAPSLSQASASIEELVVRYRGFRYHLQAAAPLTVDQGVLTLPDTQLQLVTPNGYTTRFDVSGQVTQLEKRPRMDLAVTLQPVDLAQWAQAFEAPEQIGGTVAGQVELTGPWDAPRPKGGFTLKKGVFQRRRDQIAFTDVDAEVGFGKGTLELRTLTARLGGGRIAGRGSAPFSGLSLGDFRGTLAVTDVSIPSLDGIDVTVDANLEALWSPKRDTEDYALPKITGDVMLKQFRYTRPVTMNADIASLARRGKRTEFESYDPSNDFVELDLVITSDTPIRLSNNLIEAAMRVERPGLQLTGTNQRFGLRGRLEIVPGGLIQVRRSEFEIQEGEVRFSDPTAIVPQVDVSAVTEYRRYSSGGGADASPDPASASLGTTGGEWRIYMRAHGDADNLKIDLTSQPKLSQDDIFVLLTVGLTRAELDQARAAGVGESVALEALGSLTGADTAVTEAIPVIDEFRFGSAYSSRTGRTEPTITVGKRLSERIRAYVTSGLSESREVRSNVEWQLNPQLSVETSYDNVNDISSSSLGNLGADVRWRLEFE